jgi:spore coat protein H
LVHRYFQDPKNVTALNQKMEEVASVLSEDRITTLLDRYYPIVRPMALATPDVQLLPVDAKQRFDEEYYALAKFPAESLRNYYQNLEKPLPIFIGGPYLNKDKMTFTWGMSYDLQEDAIYYDFQIRPLNQIQS